MTETSPDTPLLPILIVPNKSLKTKARRVAPADMEHVRALVPRMLATMYAAPGIGLAAPQVDIMLRLVVVDLAPNDVNAPIVLVNPDILTVSEEWATREEGCLSLPGQYADVSRPARVVVSYHDLDGAKHRIEADGLMAAGLQHESDRRPRVHAEAQHDPAAARQGAEAKGPGLTRCMGKRGRLREMSHPHQTPRHYL
jgi:peptide deformylase